MKFLSDFDNEHGFRILVELSAHNAHHTIGVFLLLLTTKIMQILKRNLGFFQYSYKWNLMHISAVILNIVLSLILVPPEPTLESVGFLIAFIAR